MCARYVAHDAPIQCNFGTLISKIQVYPDRTVYLGGVPYANIADHHYRNLPPFGLCRSLGYPPTQSATNSNNGRLTPQKCQPLVGSPWVRGKDDCLLRGYPALLTCSYCKCKYGGTITVLNDGFQANQFEMERLQKQLNEQNENDDDGWTALDTVELIPVVGSLLGIGRSLMKGQWGMAAMNVGFLAMDVGGLMSFGSTTVAATAAKTSLKAGTKIAAKTATKGTVKGTAKVAAKQTTKAAANQTAQAVDKSYQLLKLTARETEEQGLEYLMNYTIKEGTPNIFTVTTKTVKEGSSKPTIIHRLFRESNKTEKKIGRDLGEGFAKGLKGLSEGSVNALKGIKEFFEEGFKSLRNRIVNYLENESALAKFSKDLEKLKRNQSNITELQKGSNPNQWLF